MNNLGIVFYEGTLNYKEVSNILKLEDQKYLFINIRDFKEQKSIIHKFFQLIFMSNISYMSGC